MQQLPPFDLVRCSWPRPVVHHDGVWKSDPEWSAPQMPLAPRPAWRRLDRSICWMIDWREMFRAARSGDRSLAGEMSGFHIVFRVRANRTGVLTIWDDDGCVVRKDGRLLHDDRSAKMLSPFQIDVNVGDEIDVAQWQLTGGWLWGAAFAHATADATEETLSLLRPEVGARLQNPEGPPLKLYTNGQSPLRAVVAVYTLILRGYAPSEVWLFGEEQWSAAARRLFATALPFARIAHADTLLNLIASVGGKPLAGLARRYWFVMKAAVSLLAPPAEFCLVDDDVFVLDRMDDALDRFRQCDLVYMPDTDHTPAYLAHWGWIHGGQPSTGRFNAGLFWMRHVEDPKRVAEYMLRVNPAATRPYEWEQGLIALLYARRPTWELPRQRYFYPIFDGLPGGIFGYDYDRNPCRFASLHFGGLPAVKPDDQATALLLPQLLGPVARGLHAGVAVGR